MIIEGSLEQGCPEQGPYDLILLEGAVADVPSVILNQLAEKGRLVAVISSGDSLGEATIIRRIGKAFGRRILFNAASSPLPGFEVSSEFTF